MAPQQQRQFPNTRNLLFAGRSDSSRTSQGTTPKDSGDGGGGGAGEEEARDAERGQEGEDEDEGYAADHYGQPHRSVGFWHEHLSKVRRHVLLEWFKTVVILCVFIAGILSLYWAVLFRVNDSMRNLIVHVVDFDGVVAPYINNNNQQQQPFVGPLMVKLALQQYDDFSQPTLGFTVVSPARFDNDPVKVRQAVYDREAWAAVIIHANATALLRAAVAGGGGGGNASYDPAGSVQFVTCSARDQETAQTYVEPQLQALASAFSAQFGRMWAGIVAADSSVSKEAMARAPQAVNPGIVPLRIDLRPFGPPQATPTVTIGLIYLIIVAFFSFTFFLPIHMQYTTPSDHPPLHFWQLIAWRWCATVASYVLISLVYSLVSLAFQVPFWGGPASSVEPAVNATAFGRASFVVYWVINLMGMSALGIACENVAMIVGQPWTALWLIFWVITNVSTSFYAIDLMPAFFKWGYAWPLHNVVEATRTVVFDTASTLGTNLGVLAAWIVVNTLLFPLCCYFMRWKAERGARKGEKGKDRFAVRTSSGGKREVEKEVGEEAPKRNRGFMRGT